MKLRRLTSMLLILALLLSLFATVAHGAEGATRQVFRSRTCYTTYSDEQLMEMFGVSKETLIAMKEDLHYAVMNGTNWSLRSYQIPVSGENLDALMGILFHNAEYFFVESIMYSTVSGKYYNYIKPVYVTDLATGLEQHKAFCDEIDGILCQFRRDDGLTDLELALLIHDYLAANYEYDVTYVTGDEMYTAYGLLINGVGVCQAYAETFGYLMMKLGINCGLCSSNLQNHAWNIIEIDGLEYHLDVTFDDPIYDRGGPVRHTNFLVSTNVLIENGHEEAKDDMTATPANTTYDTAFWRDVRSAFCYLDGDIFYIDNSRNLCKWDDGVSTVLYNIPGKWSPWVGTFNCLASDGDRLFFSTPTAIYEYFPKTNTATVVYEPKLAEGHVIYGFKAKDNRFYIHPFNTPNFELTTRDDYEIVYQYRENEDPSHIYDQGSVLKEATCLETGEMAYTCIYCDYYKVEVLPKGDHTVATKDGLAPTCTATGLTEGKSCSVCNTVITPQEVIPATGHTEVIDTAVDATCTATGLTEGKHCGTCGEVITPQTVVPMIGHAEVVDPAVDATCTASGLTEGKHCGTCGEVLVPQTVISETGHSPIYLPKDGNTHIVACANCDNKTEAPHSYIEGICSCGEVEYKAPIRDPAIKLGHTLNLASDISINLAVSKTLLEGYDLDTVYILAEMEVYEGTTLTGTKTFKLLPVEQGNYYYFTLTGLTAINMNDQISSVLYGVKDGQEYYSNTDTYSVATYAYTQMSRAGTMESLKVLCAELLRYGAKAQIYKGYRTDRPADADMTDAQKAYLSDIDAVTFGNTNTTLDDLANPSVKWTGKSLTLDSKVCLNFVFSMGTYAGDVSDLQLRVSYTDTYGAEKSLILTDAWLYNSRLNYYAFTLDTLLAAELRSVVSVQIYAGDTPVSATLQYSADTYGNNKTGTLLDVCKALFAYSDSAKAYFAG